MILPKVNIYIAIAVVMVGLVTGLLLSNNKLVKKNAENTITIDRLKRTDSLRVAEVADSRSTAEINRKQIEEIQKTFITYRDSFEVYKKGRVCLIMKITKKPLQKADTTYIKL